MSSIELKLDRLPRTVELVRTPADGSDSSVRAGDPNLAVIDQTKLPYEEVFIALDDWRRVIEAVKTLQVRGAPAIGIAGAAALAMRAVELAASLHDEDPAAATETAPDLTAYLDDLSAAAAEISSARPTAVNLMRSCSEALEEAKRHAEAGEDAQSIADALFDFVKTLEADDEKTNRAIGSNGAELLGEGSTVLTHCNAGSLGTAFYGTALGIVYTAAGQGKIDRVYADETRPVGQGARLTTWELSRAGVPVTLICDDMAASVMASGGIDAVLVGADRITANGDVANKIGTYGVAVLARYHDIPFYVAAPSTSIDFSLASGDAIPIEQRSADEVLDRPIEGVDVLNPAFDVTPAQLVTKIITERGVYSPDELAHAYGQTPHMI